ncbi:MAG TPA: sugar ABC transporter ATP-binding protein [Tianweitania sediminis]|jgi:ribose transport system ATP-binding protein/rhamnose transport system ATP-binding protein|nr:sugar ABC transporter ATP-binding protein [Tianweitania sediminis]
MTKTKPAMGVERAPPLVHARNIAKAYGGTKALSGVDLEIAPGEVHGLVGANGAGKSTLIKVLAGLVQPDSGSVLVDGTEVGSLSSARATQLGMSFIHQELAFVPGMSVLQNIMLGVPKKTRFGMVDWAAIARDVEPIAKRVGITAPLGADVRGLSTAENWLVNICRALVRKARLIVMDEPTASLSNNEAEKLFGIVEGLSASGVAVLYVSHRLDEIERLCNRVTVFRDGRRVAELSRAELTRPRLVEAIVGKPVGKAEVRPASQPSMSEVMLRLTDVSRRPRVQGISLELHSGEVLGIGGLVGAGRSELAHLIYGADGADGGSMELEGQAFAPRFPSEAVRAGLGLVPEERRTEGLFLNKSVAFNLQLTNMNKMQSGPLLSFRKRENLALQTVRDLAIKTQSADTPVGRLSGGNQQKVVIGRWLLRAPKVLILDEPTRGVDIGARSEIHRLVRRLAETGLGVIVISSEPDELPDLADRVLIMADGKMVAELTGQQITREAIVAASYAAQTTERIVS